MMKKTALVASAVLVMAMLVSGGVAYGSSNNAKPPNSNCATRACAWVQPDGSLLPGRSVKGVVSVTHDADTGHYCVELVPTIPAATTTPIVTTDFSFSGPLGSVSNGPCGVNGILAIFYVDNQGVVAYYQDSGFTIAVP